MNKTDKKSQRIAEIKELITPFAIEYMDEETYGSCLKLVNKLGRKRVLDITRGKKEVWAASIVYVIARLNFMFDKQQDYWMTADEIAGFFGVSKSTASQKATAIEKACSIGMVDAELSRRSIVQRLQFGQLANGFILPLRPATEMEYAASKSAPEEMEAQRIFTDVPERPSRGLAFKAEKKRVAQEAREERAQLAAIEAEKKRLADLEKQPWLF